VHADAVSALAACVQSGLLIGAAGIAYWQANEARRLRRAQSQPYVVVSLESDPTHPHIISIMIKNIGTTVARNVRLEFDPPLVSTLDKESDPTRMTDWIALRDGIPTLVPGQQMGMLFDSLISRYADIENSPLPRQSRVTVRYTGDITKRQRSEVYTYAYDLDFNVYYGAHYVGRKGIDDIAKSLDQIRKAQEAWSTSHGIKVYTKDYDDHIDELMERRKQSIAKHEEMTRRLEGAKQRENEEESAPAPITDNESKPQEG
jgi:glycosyltransferase involved in cell wall biosynthesis